MIYHTISGRKFRRRQERILKLNRALKKLFPRAEIALAYKTPWQLLVAVVLSAQCTDKMVNKITPALFARFPTAAATARATPRAIERHIRLCGFYRTKAKNIVAAAHMIQKEFGGRVPRAMEGLLRVPGIARKSANVILGNAWGVVEGIAVDTHVRRFALRYDLSDHKDPVKIERDFMRLLPKKEWFPFTYRVIEYGRNIAPARRYDTSHDPLLKIYPKAAKRFKV